MSRGALRRLGKELAQMERSPPDGIRAAGDPNNMLDVYFVIEGPADTPYAGGEYLGKLRFPTEYPHKAPSLLILTPNGRFETNTRLCLSMTSFHPESWNPAWSVASILSGARSFMAETTPTYGSLENVPDEEKKRLARESRAWNARNRRYMDLFADADADADGEYEDEEPMKEPAGAPAALPAKPEQEQEQELEQEQEAPASEEATDEGPTTPPSKSTPDPSALSTRQLKKTLTALGVDTSKCVQRYELEDLFRAHAGK